MRFSVAHLRAAGLTDAQIVKVIEEVEAERREKERIKKQNQRACPPEIGDKRKAQQNQRARPLCPGDIGDNPPLSLLPSSIDSKISQQERLESVAPAPRSRARAKTEFPADWEPELEFGERREFAKFKAHALEKGRVSKNWDQAWRGWKLKIPDFQRSGGTNGRRSGSVLDALDRIGERLVAAGASEDYVPGSSGPRPLQLDQELRPANPRLISSR